MHSKINLGPISEEKSIDIEGNELILEKNTDFNIPNIGNASQEHNVKYGLFSKEEHRSNEVKLGGIFKSSEEHNTSDTLTKDTEDHTKILKLGNLFESEEHTYKSSGSGGNVEGREVETSCCGLKAASSEESSCCTSDALCGYKCSTTWCGETVSLNCNSVCCFRPICNLMSDISCPRAPEIPNCNLPNLDSLGNCISPIVNGCSGIINSIDCAQVAGCLRETWPIIRDIIEGVADLANDR